MPQCPTCKAQFAPAGFKNHRLACTGDVPTQSKIPLFLYPFYWVLHKYLQFLLFFIPTSCTFATLILAPLGVFFCIVVHILLYNAILYIAGIGYYAAEQAGRVFYVA